MRPKSLALLLLALGCGLVASIGITEVMARRNVEPGGVAGETQSIFVSTANIAMGEYVTAQVVKLEPWPKDKIPQGAISRMEDLESRRARTRLYVGEPIQDSKLLGKGASEQGATALIPKGYRVVPVRVDLQSGGSNLILPGDRVDVMVHLVRDPSREISETITRTILQDIKVFAVNEVVDMEKEKDPSHSINARTISLLVSPDQAAKVMLAQQMGTIQLVMRSPEDEQQSANAQARPGELFGTVTKSERAKETLLDTPDPTQGKAKGFLDFLNSMRTKANETPNVAASPATANRSETWTMRILQPGAVNDVVLEAEASGASDGSPSGQWKTSGSAGRMTPEVSMTGGPSAAEPAPPAEPLPPKKAKKDKDKDTVKKEVQPNQTIAQ